MARNMSFSLTTQQMRERSKTVTRRVGWATIKTGELINACVKCMGLKPGEKIERLCQIKVVDVRREPLNRMTEEIDYGFRETTLEGYPDGHDKHWPSVFVDMFCRSHAKCTPETVVTRIEFEFI